MVQNYKETGVLVWECQDLVLEAIYVMEFMFRLLSKRSKFLILVELISECSDSVMYSCWGIGLILTKYRQCRLFVSCFFLVVDISVLRSVTYDKYESVSIAWRIYSVTCTWGCSLSLWLQYAVSRILHLQGSLFFLTLKKPEV